MTSNPVRRNWFFPVTEARVHATVTHDGMTHQVLLPRRKALVAADTGEVIGVVSEGYQIFTNDQAVALCHKFCLEAFPDTKAAEWQFVDGHGPATRSWAAMDIHHQAHSMNLMGNGEPSEIYTPFVRITNSYNGTRALRVDVGFLREHCSNGVIFEQEAATLVVPHTRKGIHALKVARPFDGMAGLRDKFQNTLAALRGFSIAPDDARQLVRAVIGWPTLPENPKDWESADQTALDNDLNARLDRYLAELGKNAYAAFNTMTDLAARPPRSPRFRRDRPTLERRSGAWLRNFATASTQPGFSVAGHLKELAKN